MSQGIAADEAWVAAAAERLETARITRVPVAPLTGERPDLGLDDAYQVQSRAIAARTAAGARRVGWKIGLTSRAMQQQLGVDQPDYGPLLDDMAVADGDGVDLGTLIAPRVEGEFAFVLASDVAGPGVTAADVLDATARIVPAIEIIDSRIADWKLGLADTIADHASSALFVVGGPGVEPGTAELRLVGMILERDGEALGTGAGAAVLGDPAVAVAWLANAIAQYGERLSAGDVVLSGSLTAAVPALAGAAYTARFGAGIGSASVRFVAAGEPA